uniref:UTRA domain-containing protein n=1 Tax=Streptomyces asoensis TaxID=249586 RepID=UPI00209C40A7|nr:UTRA domain-containing protein [Streptomyces asoensis]
MRDAGYEQSEAIEEITLYGATSVEAEAFDVEVGSNVLQITHTAYTTTSRAVEVTVHRPSRLGPALQPAHQLIPTHIDGPHRTVWAVAVPPSPS